MVILTVLITSKIVILLGLYVLWRIDPLLGNDSVKIFPREPTSATIRHILLGKGSVKTRKTIRENRKRCFPWGPPRGYITGSFKGAVVVRIWENSVEEEFIWESCCRERGRVLKMAVEGDWEEMARKELGCEKKTSCVIWSNNETVINPLSGYD
jgi:hypothetical protein